MVHTSNGPTGVKKSRELHVFNAPPNQTRPEKPVFNPDGDDSRHPGFAPSTACEAAATPKLRFLQPDFLF
jgi:hypothetical protein